VAENANAAIVAAAGKTAAKHGRFQRLMAASWLANTVKEVFITNC
jgi:hypothetical protein